MGFLDLPAELRNAVYELVLSELVSSSPTQIAMSGQETTPSILQINRQIRAEAKSLLQPVDFLARLEDDDISGPLTWLNNRTKTENEAIRSFTFP